MFNLDIATGQVSTAKNASYSTKGLADTWSVKQEAPESEPGFCYTKALGSTCTEEQAQSVIDGSAVIEQYVLIDNYTSQLFPDLAAAAQNGSSVNGSGSGGSDSGSGSGSGGGSEGAATAIRAAEASLVALAVSVLVLLAF
jgi:uncharacterized membrane protein YgcG